MERPIFQPVGTPVEELDTPALVIDLDVMDRNIRTFQGYFAASAAKARPVVTSHLCPQIGHRQLAVEGTVGGIAVTTLGEAEVFANSGFSDILLANQVVTASKIRRLCALAGQLLARLRVSPLRNPLLRLKLGRLRRLRMSLILQRHLRLAGRQETLTASTLMLSVLHDFLHAGSCSILYSAALRSCSWSWSTRTLCPCPLPGPYCLCLFPKAQ